MLQLKNINHTFDVAVGDVGCTIRKGTKWAVVANATILELMNCSRAHEGDCRMPCVKEGTGEVVGEWHGEFKDLPPSLLSIEHNCEARDFKKLKEMLIRAYGSINDNDIVTALIYERKS